MRFAQHWNWEFWPFGMSRYVAGLIHADVSKGTVSRLSLWCICVWHFIYCTASSSDVHGLGWCLFQTHSHLLHGLPTVICYMVYPQSSVTWSTHSPTSPWLVFNYMHWNASFCKMRLWLTIFLCSNLCYSHWKKFLPLLLYLYRARNKITQLSILTHAQLQRHRLKFIKNHLKTPTCFDLRPSSGSYNVLAKITIILTTVGCFYAKSRQQH